MDTTEVEKLVKSADRLIQKLRAHEDVSERSIKTMTTKVEKAMADTTRGSEEHRVLNAVAGFLARLQDEEDFVTERAFKVITTKMRNYLRQPVAA